MKFLCLVEFAPDAFDGVDAAEQRRLADATIAHDRKLRQSEHLLFASPLTGPEEAATIDRRRRVTVDAVDGPFAEAKEMIGGFLLIEARDMAEAKSLFEDDPIAEYGKLTLRPVIEHHRHSVTGEARPDFAQP